MNSRLRYWVPNDGSSGHDIDATPSIVYSFQNRNDSAQPQAALLVDAAGNLYGTSRGLAGDGNCPAQRNYCGSIFELLAPARRGGAWTIDVLLNFNLTDGASPRSDLIFDAAGNLYGSAGGGSSGHGIVFELVRPASPRGQWKEKILYTFAGGADGDNPQSGLTVDRSGTLYGTTIWGGNASFTGTIYKLAPPAQPNGSYTHTVLYRFAASPNVHDGYWPVGDLRLDAAGALYGVTQWGGYYDESTCGGGCGTVFMLSPAKTADGVWQETVLHRFTGSADGALPMDGLIFDRFGDLFGTTFEATHYTGTVFELSPPAGSGPWTETVLHRFPSNDSGGGYPAGRLIFDAAGNLYGTTTNGGQHQRGTVYRLVPPAKPGGSWTLTDLHDFAGDTSDGSFPADGLIFGLGGLLYGTTPYNGSGRCPPNTLGGCGTIFEVAP